MKNQVLAASPKSSGNLFLFLALVLFGACPVCFGQEPASVARESLFMNIGWKFKKVDLHVNHWGKFAVS